MEQLVNDYLVEQIERYKKYRQDAIDRVASYNISIKGSENSIAEYDCLIKGFQKLLDNN